MLNSKMTKSWLTVLLGLSLTNPVAAIVVTTTDDGEFLGNTILGEGINITNMTYTGGLTASGTFTDGLSSGLGFDSGIILTTGDANLADGPNIEDDTTEVNGLPGDPDLDALIPSFFTNDATILEIEFTSEGGDLFFNYVFASEEYNEFVDSEFNDVFGFFLDGTNVAIISGSATPVAINNVNCGNPFADSGPNCDRYNNNDPSDGGPLFDIEYDGFTDALTVSALDLAVGTHTIRLAVGDAGDSILDSAVFIERGSFSDRPMPEPATLGLFVLGFALLASTRRRKASV